MLDNACIILKNIGENLTSLDYQPIADAFSASGYPFKEISIQDLTDEKAFLRTLKRFRDEYNYKNVAVIAREEELRQIGEWLYPHFAHTRIMQSLGGAGIYEDNVYTVFLLSTSRLSTGLGFLHEKIAPWLAEKQGGYVSRMVIRAVTDKHYLVDQFIYEAKAQCGEGISYSYTDDNDDITLTVAYDNTVTKAALDKVLRIFAKGLDGMIYALDDTPLEKQLVELLKLRGKRISVAESFTGGGIGRRIVSVPGASRVYFEGLNTYNEQSKIKRLGVSPMTIRSAGVVSDRTAYEMAAGLIETGDCDISIATTGFAGPSDSPAEESGLCFIAVGFSDNVYVYRFRLTGGRKEVTEKAINHALFLAYTKLKEG